MTQAARVLITSSDPIPTLPAKVLDLVAIYDGTSRAVDAIFSVLNMPRGSGDGSEHILCAETERLSNLGDAAAKAILDAPYLEKADMNHAVRVIMHWMTYCGESPEATLSAFARLLEKQRP